MHDSLDLFWKEQYWISLTHSTPSQAAHEDDRNQSMDDERGSHPGSRSMKGDHVLGPGAPVIQKTNHIVSKQLDHPCAPLAWLFFSND